MLLCYCGLVVTLLFCLVCCFGFVLCLLGVGFCLICFACAFLCLFCFDYRLCFLWLVLMHFGWLDFCCFWLHSCLTLRFSVWFLRLLSCVGVLIGFAFKFLVC